ncbi:MAG: tryptophan-rich sensory protein [Atopobiaceae bacterium]|nr:tryptophan-rich sensory protein [Atopobiaceae bacterium]
MNAPTSTNRRRPLLLIAFIALPLVVGGISSALTANAMTQFGQFEQPPLSPPAWLFPVAWTILYMLMGLASYLIYLHVPKNAREHKMRMAALVIYGLQLTANFAWSLVFFGLNAYWIAFALLVVLWAHVLALVMLAIRLRATAGYALLPYLAWTTFAGYLNAGVAVLN